MLKRFLSVVAVLVVTGALVGISYTTNNPIVISQTQSEPEVAGSSVRVPTGWTTGSNDTEDGEHIDMFMDTDNVMRVAVGAVDVDISTSFEHINRENIKTLCETIIAADDPILNVPKITEDDVCYYIDYQYNIENDLVYVNFCIPKKYATIYEIIEVKPSSETKLIRDSVIKAIREEV